jgi:hypothetical protein
LKVQGCKLRVFEVYGGISKRLIVRGGLVKFPQNNFIVEYDVKKNKNRTMKSYYIVILYVMHNAKKFEFYAL